MRDGQQVQQMEALIPEKAEVIKSAEKVHAHLVLLCFEDIAVFTGL